MAVVVIYDYLIPVFTYWVVCCIAGAIIGHTRERTRAGAAWGLVLGIIGVIVAFFLKPPGDGMTELERRRAEVDAENARRRAEYHNPDRPKY